MNALIACCHRRVFYSVAPYSEHSVQQMLTHVALSTAFFSHFPVNKHTEIKLLTNPPGALASQSFSAKLDQVINSPPCHLLGNAAGRLGGSCNWPGGPTPRITHTAATPQGKRSDWKTNGVLVGSSNSLILFHSFISRIATRRS